jgi:acetyl-CoA acetyltransferase
MDTRSREPIAAITGLGFSQMSRAPIGTIRELAGAAVLAAIADAGLVPADVDGLLLNKSPTAAAEELPLLLQNDLGLRDLALLAAIDSEGSSAVQMAQYAALAVRHGMARAVACVFSDTPVKGGSAGNTFAIAMPLSGIEGWEQQQGFLGAVAGYAMAARRHMTVYGTTAEQLGAYAVACRRWAQANPMALLKKPLTLDDYLASPFVVEPFRLLDCCFPVNGAAAVVVTAVERAQDAPRPPVYIHGMGQGHRGRSGLREDEPELRIGASQAGRTAYKAAGIVPADISQCQLYDAFSFAGIVSLEAYGLCPEGEGGRFVADGHTAPGGRLPVNTGGGHLSGYYLQGMTPISEAMIQVRGLGGDRQARNDIVLVSGNGGCLDYHASLVVSPHRTLG